MTEPDFYAKVDELFDEVVSAREALRNTSLRTDCHDFEVMTISWLELPLHGVPGNI